jgi:bidirectional [NiFe] hydrogenase diaphorase subunit
MPDKISIRIDGEYVAAEVGQTILEVARAGGKYIPTLCWLENVSPVGACRLCIVEVSGVNRLLPACTTPVQDGMSVTTNPRSSSTTGDHPRVPLRGAQPRVRGVRLQQPLRAADHGAAAGRDQRALSVRVSPSCRWMFRTSATCWTTTAASSVRAACGCARKWRARACGTSSSRGIRSMVVRYEPAVGRGASCTSCGKCVQVCPTGALAEKGQRWRRW